MNARHVGQDLTIDSLLFHTTAHGFGDYKAKTDIIDTLTVASEDRKAVMLTYQSQHATEQAGHARRLPLRPGPAQRVAVPGRPRRRRRVD